MRYISVKYTVKFFYTILLLNFLVSGCQNKNDLGSELYDELLEITRISWIDLRSDISKGESLYEQNVGDSIILKKQQFLNTNYTDSALYLGEGFYLSINDLVVVLEVDGFGYKVKTKNDSIGYINKVELENEISDGMYLFGYKFRFDRAQEKYDEAIEDLRSKHNLTIDEFRHLLSEEHFKRTGEQFFWY